RPHGGTMIGEAALAKQVGRRGARALAHATLGDGRGETVRSLTTLRAAPAPVRSPPTNSSQHWGRAPGPALAMAHLAGYPSQSRSAEALTDLIASWFGGAVAASAGNSVCGSTASMAVKRINRAIELLEQDQAVYYIGAHTGHVLTHAQGKEDAPTWARSINV